MHQAMAVHSLVRSRCLPAAGTALGAFAAAASAPTVPPWTLLPAASAPADNTQSCLEATARLHLVLLRFAAAALQQSSDP